MKIHNFKELTVWQKAIELAIKAYSLTARFPKDERFGLISQIQRCAVSISSNIAEGCGRVSDNQLKYFLSISMGSAYELETQLILAFRLNYLEKEVFNECCELVKLVQKMLFRFYKSLEK